MSLLAVGMAAAGLLIGAASNYSAQKAENKRATAEAQAARVASAEDLYALLEQGFQMQQATNTQILERQRQALRDRSRLMVAAGEAGVGGNSTLRLLANNMWDSSYDIGIRETNLENQMLANAQQARAVAAQRDSRVNQARSRIQNPWLTAAVGIGSALPSAITAYQGYRKGG